MSKNFPLVLLTIIFLSGCAPFTPGQRNPELFTLPENYNVDNGDIIPSTRWWEEFNSQELNSLIEKALSQSFDVQVADARLRQAQAVARKVGADLMPSLNGTSSAEHVRRSTMSGPNNPRQESTSDNLGLGVAMSYELDLWGKLRSNRQSELSNVQAKSEDLETARISVTASIADVWLQLITTRAEIDLVKTQIETNKTLLEALTLRFNNALTTGLDVLQQQELYTASLASLPLLYATEDNLQNQLAILLGLLPGTEPKISVSILPSIPAFSPELPLDILMQRPDVRSSWHSLISTDYSLSSAKADRLPSLVLNAEAVYSGAQNVLFSNWITSLGANLTAPLFDGGRRQAEVDRLQALVDEKIQIYAKTVATAIGEVQNALASASRQNEYVTLLARQLDLANTARTEARQSYLNGRDTFLRFITQHQNVQNLEQNLLRQQSVLMRNRIALHRSIGGKIS